MQSQLLFGCLTPLREVACVNARRVRWLVFFRLYRWGRVKRALIDALTKPLQGPQLFKLRALALGHAVP